jgi:hypothetical protein
MFDPTDNRGVPMSQGIPDIVVWSGFIGIALIFVVAALVLSQAAFGHMWPAQNTLTLKL